MKCATNKFDFDFVAICRVGKQEQSELKTLHQSLFLLVSFGLYQILICVFLQLSTRVSVPVSRNSCCAVEGNKGGLRLGPPSLQTTTLIDILGVAFAASRCLTSKISSSRMGKCSFCLVYILTLPQSNPPVHHWFQFISLSSSNDPLCQRSQKTFIFSGFMCG